MIFEPYHDKAQDRYLVDGGLTRNLPLQDAVSEYTGDTIIAVNVNALDVLPDKLHEKRFWGFKKDMMRYLNHSFSILMNSQWRDITDPRVSIITPNLMGYNGFSVAKKNYEPIVQSGRDAAVEFLKKVR